MKRYPLMDFNNASSFILYKINEAADDPSNLPFIASLHGNPGSGKTTFGRKVLNLSQEHKLNGRLIKEGDPKDYIDSSSHEPEQLHYILIESLLSGVNSVKRYSDDFFGKEPDLLAVLTKDMESLKSKRLFGNKMVNLDDYDLVIINPKARI
jgi:hypothetical protein